MFFGGVKGAREQEVVQGTESTHLGTAQGPGVSRGPHEMPLVPFYRLCLSVGKDTGAP
ncbi:unnamed protein product [Staurois parvus]|uniref:Uncharacterized protein n=1 Tax=Staurois parvus TaxID=386267 RepID=A0ABN9C2M4_9NEOB|nr:unnamed protein product [Staurois parvus]